MAGSDWIKLHRSMLKSPIFQHDGLFRLWTYCLLRANWEPRKWLIPGTMQEIEVPRGAFITGRQSLFASLYPQSDADGILIKREYAPSPITVWRWVKSLESMGCVTVETVNNRCSLVTICNYSTYQDQKTTDEQVVNRSRSGGEQVVITNKEQQEFKNDITHTTQGDSLTFLTGPTAAQKAFRDAYPNKIKPKQVYAEFAVTVAELVAQRQMTDQDAEEFLIEKAEAYAASPAGMPPPPGQDEDFRPSGAEWLKAGRYDEPYSVWMKPNIKGNRNGNGSGGYSRGGKKPPSECVGVGEPIDIEAIINSVPITRSSEKST